METIDKNKMIIDFMGIKPKLSHDKKVFSYADSPYFHCTGESEEEVLNSVAKYVKYDTDWNWIMKVVEKIETMTYNTYEISFRISKYAVCLQSLAEDGAVIDNCIFSKWATYGGTEKLRATYDACVEFIDWHNKNK